MYRIQGIILTYSLTDDKVIFESLEDDESKAIQLAEKLINDSSFEGNYTRVIVDRLLVTQFFKR